MEYIVSGGLFVFMIGSLVAVKVGLANRPTFEDLKKKADELQRKDLCAQINKSVEEKLGLIPKMRDTLIKIAAKMGCENER